MLYFDFEAGNNTYKLKLTTQDIVNLEKRLGCNPLMVFGNGDRVPTVTEMVNVLHCSLQKFHHGITLADAYNIFDDYLETHVMTDFIAVMVDIYKVSGIIQKDKKLETNEVDDNEKN